MRKVLFFVLFIGLAGSAWGDGSNTIPPVKDVGTDEDIRRDIRRANESMLPRSGGDDLFYRDIKNEYVGIGTTEPACKLDVTGTACFDSVTADTAAITSLTVTTLTASTVTATNIVNGSPFMMRNRIINGDMRIDQRTVGTSTVTANTTAGVYGIDRWRVVGQAADGVFTARQNTTTAPTSQGFTHVLLSSVTTADTSIAATQSYFITQRIEGNNVADFAFGTSGAKSVVLSFWVRSSTTGVMGGVIQNGAANRSYPFTYTIDAVDTWEQESVRLAGDTTGTWATDVTTGIVVLWSLGAGSTVTGTPGAWAASDYKGATGQKNLIGTANLTLSLTGVQFEIGNVITPFERRFFQAELAACQRYYEKSYDTNTAPAALTTTSSYAFRAPVADWSMNIPFTVVKRTSPTLVYYNPNSGAAASWRNYTAGNDRGITTDTSGPTSFSWQNTASFTAGDTVRGHWTADAEL